MPAPSLAECKDVFAMFDKNRDDSVDKDEFMISMANFNAVRCDAARG